VYVINIIGMQMELLGLYEIANLARVSPQAVSNWVARKAHFPKPLAQLASGSVWDAATMRSWLEREGLIPDAKKRNKNMKNFVVGREYTLSTITIALGGETMSYLPQFENRIVCGRFKVKDMNPNAPYEILVGDLPKVRRKAELLAAQGGVIPVFLKEAPNRWRFHGSMHAVGFVTDPNVVQATSGVDKRKDKVIGILTLQDEN
jgi:hypothetical protein